MPFSEPARSARRGIPWILIAGLVVVLGVNAAALGYPLLASSPTPDVADGALPDGTTVFDGQLPGVSNLNPALLGALREAATDAADAGVEFFVDSGWRSSEYQQQLLDEAVSEYGSGDAAARWVATPTTSAHVSGDAVDLGPADATAWLSRHGARYGLCQIYRNEPWHYELRSEAVARGCPPMYADPTQDPRMQHPATGTAGGELAPTHLPPLRTRKHD